jgi:hypothetical protein
MPPTCHDIANTRVPGQLAPARAEVLAGRGTQSAGQTPPMPRASVGIDPQHPSWVAHTWQSPAAPACANQPAHCLPFERWHKTKADTSHTVVFCITCIICTLHKTNALKLLRRGCCWAVCMRSAVEADSGHEAHRACSMSCVREARSWGNASASTAWPASVTASWCSSSCAAHGMDVNASVSTLAVNTTAVSSHDR